MFKGFDSGEKGHLNEKDIAAFNAELFKTFPRFEQSKNLNPLFNVF